MDIMDITDKQSEIMDISQEECAEVIQAISKIRRFGLDSEHNGVTNKEHLEEEVGDLMCMLNLLDEFGLVDWTLVSLHAQNKRKKLQKWTKIFENENT
jgi:NTP pyrophosphatase (non-canonical NTP hydrolase)